MERTTRAAGHGQDGWLVTGSLRRWDCSGGNVDVITDFSTGQSDKLNLADVLDFDPLTQQCDHTLQERFSCAMWTTNASTFGSIAGRFATSAVCTSLRCCGPTRAAGVARGVRGCGRAGGLRRSPVAGGGSWREHGAGRRQRVGARAKGLYFFYSHSGAVLHKGHHLLAHGVLGASARGYCQPGKIAASPCVMNSTAIAAMSNPMIWVKTRIPVRPISTPITSASLSTTKVLAATATMTAQMSR